MKLTKYSLRAMAIASLALAGCHDNADYDLGNNKAKGGIDLSGIGVEVAPGEIEISRAADPDIDTSSFTVTLVDADGNTLYTSTVDKCSEIVTLPVGDSYRAVVESHEVENAAWSRPYYAGSKAFSITENEITDIGTVTCSFANIRVSVRYTDDLRKLMGSDCRVTVKCSETGSMLEYAPDETRSGYFKALDGSTTLGAVFEGSVNGSQVALTKALNDVKAGQHRIITFGVKSGNGDVPDEFGDINLDGEGDGTPLGNGLYLVASVIDESVDGNVSSDETAGDDKRPGSDENIGGGDDPNPPTPPVGEPIKIEATALSFDKPNTAAAGVNGEVKVNTDNPITSLKVVIEPDPSTDFEKALNDMLGGTQFDLADIAADKLIIYKESLKLPVNDEVKGKTEVTFDISEFIPLLNIYPGTHRFVITVTDNAGNSLSKTLTFIATGD